MNLNKTYNDNVFFIIGCGRSGTTAVAEILNTATNGLVDIESNPKLCVASRLKYNNILPNSKNFINSSLSPKIDNALKSYDIYADKNPNYIYFIDELQSVFNAKFLFVIRDGSDVVRSCMDFDKFRTPNYAFYEDTKDFSFTQAEDNFWDFGRIRPLPTDSYYNKWYNMSKFEKFSWYWSNYNKLLLNNSKNIPDNKKMFLNISNINSDVFKDIFEFFSLDGYNKAKIEEMFSSEINTTKVSSDKRFKSYSNWSLEQKNIFKKHSKDMMKYFGYKIL